MAETAKKPGGKKVKPDTMPTPKSKDATIVKMGNDQGRSYGQNPYVKKGN